MAQIERMSRRKYSRPFCFWAFCALLVLAGCKGRTHITGTVKNKWGSPIYMATVTLTAGKRKQQTQTSLDGKFEIGLDHTIFKTDLKLTVTNVDYQTIEKSFSSKDGLQTLTLIMQQRPEPTLDEIRKSQLKGITLQDAKELAELMCRQLPNAAAFPLKSFLSGDDVHDTLVLLSGVAQPCLVDRITDSTWMPDSRSEPLAAFHAGDAALWILADAGLDWGKVVVPLLNQKQWNGVGVFAYFDWINRGNHRKLVQDAVKRWLKEHPECCGSEKDVNGSTPANAAYRIDPQRLLDLKQRLAGIRPGMDEKQVRLLLGPPDQEASGQNLRNAVIEENRYEKSALFYFVERHTGKIGLPGSRDYLRDRYVIVFFSENGKFTRAFSNVSEIPPIYPRSEKLWTRILYASMAVHR